MFEPIYDDSLDEYGESTYKLVGYEVDEESILVLPDHSMEELTFEGTGRELEELLDYGLVIVTCGRKTYTLEEFLEEDIKHFIGKDVTFDTE